MPTKHTNQLRDAADPQPTPKVVHTGRLRDAAATSADASAADPTTATATNSNQDQAL